MQKKDLILKQVRTFVTSDSWPEGLELRALDPALRLYAALRTQLSIVDNLLVRTVDRVGKPETRLYCLPDRMQASVMKQCHEGIGHRGVNATFEQTAQRFFFPSMSVQARMTVAECHRCQKHRGAPKAQRHTLVSQQDPDGLKPSLPWTLLPKL